VVPDIGTNLLLAAFFSSTVMGAIVGKVAVKLSLIVPSSFKDSLGSADLEGVADASDEEETDEEDVEDDELVSGSMGVSLPAEAVSWSTDSVELPPKSPFSLPVICNYKQKKNRVKETGQTCKRFVFDLSSCDSLSDRDESRLG
jgi:hypothetical protein